MNGRKMNPHLILVIGVLGISCSAIFVKTAQAPSVITATYRLLWTVVLLTPSALFFHRKEWGDVQKKDVIWCCLSGIFLAFHFSSWFASLKYTSVASSMAIMSTEVIFTALGFALFLKGKIGKKAWGCIALAVVGSIVIALTDQASATNAIYGDFLALLGAIFISGYTLIGRQQRGHLSNTIYTYMVYSACAVTLLLMDAVTATPVFGWGWKELLIGLCLALFCTLLGHSLF
ncbi:MAG: DMT family transporter, partial [Lachnospiraceae bacterium]|nr:DMT family transporter [Lachnospiraceae bacterium]